MESAESRSKVIAKWEAKFEKNLEVVKVRFVNKLIYISNNVFDLYQKIIFISFLLCFSRISALFEVQSNDFHVD